MPKTGRARFQAVQDWREIFSKRQQDTTISIGNLLLPVCRLPYFKNFALPI
jgi:hypothetical protein